MTDEQRTEIVALAKDASAKSQRLEAMGYLSVGHLKPEERQVADADYALAQTEAMETRGRLVAAQQRVAFTAY